MSLGNPFILGSKSQSQGQESQKHCRRGNLHPCECWLLLVPSAFLSVKLMPTEMTLGLNETTGVDLYSKR